MLELTGGGVGVFIGWSCQCEIKPVINKNRSNVSEENKKGT